jgi:hypothetical protein
MLDGVHGLAAVCEAVRGPERLWRRLYDGALALHLFRGLRQSWSA